MLLLRRFIPSRQSFPNIPTSPNFWGNVQEVSQRVTRALLLQLDPLGEGNVLSLFHHHPLASTSASLGGLPCVDPALD